jgi:hypothetical protein
MPSSLPSATVCIDIKAKDIDDAEEFLIDFCNEVTNVVQKGV